jgi:hypothetical protein
LSLVNSLAVEDSITASSGFIYILMGILICEGGNAGNILAVFSTVEGVMVTFLPLLQPVIQTSNATTGRKPEMCFIVWY